MENPIIAIKRIYEPASPDDGFRILVDRLWPRGISKERASIDGWMKEIAPSPELRKSFCHQPERFAAFCEQYRRELAESQDRLSLAGQIYERSLHQNVTLLYAASDPVYNHAIVLRQWLIDTFYSRQ